MEKLSKTPFNQLLAKHRESLNQRFEDLRRHRPHLRPDDFRHHLEHLVAPIVNAVAQHHPTAAPQVLNALYDLSLHMLAKGWLAHPTRMPALIQGWQMVLPRIPHLLASDCRQTAVALTNALFRLARFPQVDLNRWLQLMALIGPTTRTLQQWLDWGQLVAWRCGMAHYRQQLAPLWHTLPAPWVRYAFDILPWQNLAAVWQQLDHNPWLKPAEMLTDQPVFPSQVAQWGDFRALGGLFHHPPQVSWDGQTFVVWDRHWLWQLAADGYGITLGRIGQSTFPHPGDQTWQEHWQPTWQDLAHQPDVSSIAANQHTLIFTHHCSFRLTVMARRPHV